MTKVMETQQISDNRATAEWFSAWMPRPDPEIVRDPKPDWLDEVRMELKFVIESLLDPSAEGVRASLPHLERAVSLFGAQMPKLTDSHPGTEIKPAIESLQAELKLATRLFENAYTLQAGWAALMGLNVDGTPQKMLYDHMGELVSERTGASVADGVWEG